MRSRQESYEQALAKRLALLRAELMGEPLPPAPEEGPVGVIGTPVAAVASAAPAGGGGAGKAGEAGVEAGEAGVVSGPGDEAATLVPIPGRHASRRIEAPSWLPQALLAPGPVAVVAVLLSVGLAFTAWWALRSQPEPLPSSVPVAAGLATPLAVPGATPQVPASGAGAGAPGSPGASGAAPTEVVVHVAGRVRRPGIVVLRSGDRVADAVQAAGGALPRVDLASLNLARLVVDGEQILVGVGPPAAAAGSASTGATGGTGSAGAGAGDGRINLNTATAAQLEELPGVGPVTAASIIAFREEHGAFTSVEELLDVSGIGEATLAEIAPHATI